MAGRRLPDDQRARVRAGVEKLLRKHGSQLELEKILGYDQTHISKVANGEARPGLEFAAAVAKALGEPLADFLNGHHVRTPEERLDAIEAAQIEMHGLLRELLARLPEPPGNNATGELGAGDGIRGVYLESAAGARLRQHAAHGAQKPAAGDVRHEPAGPDRRRKAKP